MNDEPMVCNLVATYYDDTAGPGNLRIGNGFKGYIRKIKIYDWFKHEQDQIDMYRTAPACYKFHHSQGD